MALAVSSFHVLSHQATRARLVPRPSPRRASTPPRMRWAASCCRPGGLQGRRATRQKPNIGQQEDANTYLSSPAKHPHAAPSTPCGILKMMLVVRGAGCFEVPRDFVP